jgi:hypothetical protein
VIGIPANEPDRKGAANRAHPITPEQTRYPDTEILIYGYEHVGWDSVAPKANAGKGLPAYEY